MNTQSYTSSLRGPRVLEHTLRAMAGALERGLFAEQTSGKSGLFQSLDARVKVLAVLALLIGVSASHSLLVILAVYLLTVILAWRSSISPAILVGRVWLALPFFTGVIALPALFLTPGPALIALPLGLVVTRTGATSAMFLLLRVSASVSLTLLLILTTPWNAVLRALGALGVPAAFALILGMTYRYIYVLLRAANDMFLSRQSRVVGRLTTAQNQQMLAAAGASLLGKSLHLSGEVYLAMQSRGFRGSAVSLRPLEMHALDWFWLGAFAVISILALIAGR